MCRYHNTPRATPTAEPENTPNRLRGRKNTFFRPREDEVQFFRGERQTNSRRLSIQYGDCAGCEIVKAGDDLQLVLFDVSAKTGEDWRSNAACILALALIASSRF